MSDPVGDRLQDYYRSIQREPSAGLEAGVMRAFGSAAAAPRAPLGRWSAIAGFGAASAAVAALVIATLVLSSISPVASPNPSDLTGPSGSPSPSSVIGPSASATSDLATPSGVPGITELPSTGPSPSATPTPATTPTPAPRHDYYSKTGAMTPWLSGPAVTLKNGRVLVAGGMYRRSDGISLKTNAAELYNPATGKFTATGSMADQRFHHTATLLKDGRVLVVGGADLSDGIDNLATAELYDPATGKFTPTGSMAQGRAEHTATLLPSGRVLIAGGFGGGTNSLASAEIYDPATGKFTAAGPMSISREYHTATLLPSGLVLIAGGLDDGGETSTATIVSSAELFNPATGQFTPAGSMPGPRAHHTATPLQDGRVLLTGGVGADQVTALKTADIYDPATGHFTATGSMGAARQSHTATQLVDARVLIAGGDSASTGEVYDPSTGRFSGKRNLFGRVDAAARLGDGRVLLTGPIAQLFVP